MIMEWYRIMERYKFILEKNGLNPLDLDDLDTSKGSFNR